MFRAAEEGDAIEVARLTKMVREKLKLERLWCIENWLTCSYEHHPRLRRWLHEELVAIGWRRADYSGYSTC